MVIWYRDTKLEKKEKNNTVGKGGKGVNNAEDIWKIHSGLLSYDYLNLHISVRVVFNKIVPLG